MYVEEMVGEEAPSYDENLGWGFSLPSFIPNPVSVIQHAANVVQAHTPAPFKKLSPINIVRRQLSDVRKVRAQHTALLKFAAMKSPIARKMPGVDRWTGALAAKKAAQAQAYAQSQADAKAQADADAQYAKDQAAYDAQQTQYDKEQAQAQTDADAAQARQDAVDAEQARMASDAPQPSYAAQSQTYDPSSSELDPMSSQDVNAAPDIPAEAALPDSGPSWLDTYYQQDNSGDNMQLSNIESSKLLPSNTFKSSRMGDIWGDIMSTASTMYGQKTAASIQQSQAAQADASARIAAANAAAVAAQSRPAISTPVMLAGAAGLFALLMFMRKKGRA